MNFNEIHRQVELFRIHQSPIQHNRNRPAISHSIKSKTYMVKVAIDSIGRSLVERLVPVDSLVVVCPVEPQFQKPVYLVIRTSISDDVTTYIEYY